MKHFKGCLLKAFEEGQVSCIAHQVNCQVKMGAGIGKSIRQRFPQHYEDYMEYCADAKQIEKRDGFKDGELLLGDSVTTSSIQGDIVGLFGQLHYGRGKRQTNYAALLSALDNYLASQVHPPFWRVIGIPYGIGCGLAGGDWRIVSTLLEDYEKCAGIEFYVYEL